MSFRHTLSAEHSALIAAYAGDRPIVIHASLIKACHGSPSAAILIQQLTYWVMTPSNQSGEVYNTTRELEAQTGLSYERQRSARKLLGALGLLSERYDQKEGKFWFRPNISAICQAIHQAQLKVGESQEGGRGKPRGGSGKAKRGVGESLDPLSPQTSHDAKLKPDFSTPKMITKMIGTEMINNIDYPPPASPPAGDQIIASSSLPAVEEVAQSSLPLDNVLNFPGQRRAGIEPASPPLEKELSDHQRLIDLVVKNLPVEPPKKGRGGYGEIGGALKALIAQYPIWQIEGAYYAMRSDTYWMRDRRGIITWIEVRANFVRYAPATEKQKVKGDSRLDTAEEKLARRDRVLAGLRQKQG